MKVLPALVFTSLAASAFAVPLPVSEGTTLRFAPEAGKVVTKSFRAEMELGFEELTSTMNGQEVPSEFLPDMDIQVTRQTDTVVTDEYVAVKDGRPAKLRRTFDTVTSKDTSSFTMPPEAEQYAESEGESALEGTTVLFDWDAEEEDYTAEFAKGTAAEEELLEGLSEDMDLRAFLPKDAVEPGDSWKVEAHHLAYFFAPGGDLSLVDSNPALQEELERHKGGELEGTLTLRFAGWDEGGKTLAVLEVTGDASRESETETTLDHIPVVDGTATETLTDEFSVEGRLVWDTAGHHLASVALEVAMSSTTFTEKDPGQEGPEFDATVVMRGRWTFEVTTTSE